MKAVVECASCSLISERRQISKLAEEGWRSFDNGQMHLCPGCSDFETSGDTHFKVDQERVKIPIVELDTDALDELDKLLKEANP